MPKRQFFKATSKTELCMKPILTYFISVLSYLQDMAHIPFLKISSA